MITRVEIKKQNEETRVVITIDETEKSTWTAPNTTIGKHFFKYMKRKQ